MLPFDYFDYNYQSRMLYKFSFLFKFLFPHEHSGTIGTNYLKKVNGQSILMTGSCSYIRVFMNTKNCVFFAKK